MYKLHINPNSTPLTVNEPNLAQRSKTMKNGALREPKARLDFTGAERRSVAT